MSNIHEIQFVYSNGESMTIKDKSFFESVKLALNGNFDKLGTPIKVLFPTTNKVLYFDDDYFRNFVQGNISQPELLELTTCDGLFRNIEPYPVSASFEIDAGSLWKKQSNRLILVDVQQYIESYNFAAFTEI